nr:S6 family peptidase [Alysiella crassa]UOP06371.1 autotransporter outer membrane beta-barrel domain-containing protein [Alysiella crassa]
MRKKPRKMFKKTAIATLISLSAAPLHVHAASVRSDIDYQLYRDFAENRGQFVAGATNIPITKKDGTPADTLLPENIPMPDFSPVLRNNGVATLIAPQYLVSVAHNGGYQTAQFGHTGNNPDQHVYDYQLVDRNNYPKGQSLHDDYHAPRLHKLVTETAPAEMNSVGSTPIKNDTNPYWNKSRFPAYVRVGGGGQFVREADGTNNRAGNTYSYRTGGNTLTLSHAQDGWLDFRDGDWYTADYNKFALPNHLSGGDSGSPTFAYDADEKRWVIVGTAVFNDGNNGVWYRSALMRPEFHAETANEDNATPINNTQNNAVFNWTADGNSSTITAQGSTTAATTVKLMDTAAATNAEQLHHGQTLYLGGNNATLNLNQSINQGAGALHFSGNYTVAASDNSITHTGAGVSIDADKTVTWKVNNPDGDRLSKIGAGTLYVNGSGVNSGSLSVGDGKVVLAQRADSTGQKQAFNEVGIVSGRGTVVLDSADQMDLNKLYFGYRGGRLDANGKHIAFNYIQNVDEGAQIVNHAPQQASLTISPKAPDLLTENTIPWSDWGKTSTGLYEYRNPYAGGRTDYFVLKQGHSGQNYFPTDGTSNHAWEFLGSDKQAAMNTYLSRENEKRSQPRLHAFNGWFGETDTSKTNGALNVHYAGTVDKDILMVSGGTNLNGNLRVSRGQLLLSGRHTPHAYDHQNNREIIDENDWQTRDFTATEFIAEEKGSLHFGRNVGNIMGNITVRDTARATVGYVANQTPVCVRSDQNGTVSCTETALSDNVLANMTASNLLGNVAVEDYGTFTLGKTNFSGSLNVSNTSTTNFEQGALWRMPSAHTLGNVGGDGGRVVLNPRNTANGITQGDSFETLTIHGTLSGSLNFDYLTDLANQRGDQVIVNGVATGNHTLSVQNTAAEPTEVKRLTLLKLRHGAQDENQVNVKLANDYVDAGTWRYTLASNESHDYYLHNPVKEQEIAQAEAAEKQKQAELAAQQAVEQAAKLAAAQAAQAAAEQELATLKQNSGADAAAVAEAQKALAEKQAELAQAQADKAAAEAEAAQAKAQAATAQAQASQAESDKVAAQQAAQAAATAQAAAEAAQKQAQADKLAAQQAATEAQQALAAAEQARLQAIAEQEKAQVAATEARKQAELAAQQAAEQAEKLAQAQAAQAAAEQELATLKQNSGADAAAVAEAQKALAETQAQLAQAQADKAAAEATAAQAQAQAAAAQAQASQAENDKVAAQQAAQAAATAQAAAEAAQKQAEADKLAAQQAQAAAEQARLQAIAEQEKAQVAATEARKQAELAAQQATEQAEKLAQAQAAQAAAEQELAALKQNSGADAIAVAEAQKALAEAQGQLAQAQADKAAAEAAATQAQAQATAAQAQASQAENDKIAAQQAAQAAATAQATAEAAQKQAQADKLAAQHAATEAQNALLVAQQAQAAAEQARKQAEAQLQKLTENAQAAEAAQTQKLAEAQAALQAAQSAQTAAQQAAALATEKQQAAEAAAQQAQTQLAAAQAAQVAAEQQMAAEQTAKANAQAALTAAQAETAAAQTALAQANQALATQTAATEAANSQLSAAQQAQAAAEQAAQAAQAQLAKLQQDNATNTDSLKTAEAAAAQAKAELAAAQTALNQAQAAQAAAIAAQQQAEADKASALAQAATAQAAQQAAESAQQAAQAQTASAQAKQAQAEAQAAAAQAAQKTAEAAAQQAQAEKQNALAAQAAAELAQKNAEASATQAQATAQAALQAQKAAEAELAHANANSQTAQAAQAAAELARKNAEQAAAQAEADKQAALTAQANAEQAQKAAETALKQAQADAQAAETAKQTAQNAQTEAQNKQAAAETAKQQAEQAAQAAQMAKKAAEDALAAAEAEKIAAQRALAAAENAKTQAQQAAAAEQAAKEAALAAQKAAEAAAQAATQSVPQAQLVSKWANAALSEWSAQAQSVMNVGHRLDERVLSVADTHDGIWVATHARNHDYQSDLYRKYEQDEVLAQFGVDKTTRTASGSLTVGAVLNHARGEQTYDEATGESELSLISAYSKAQLDNGVMIAADVGAGQAKSDVKLDNLNTSIKRSVAQVGVKSGYQFETNGLNVLPYVGVRYHHLGQADYVLPSRDGKGATVAQDSVGVTEYQMGVRVAKSFTTPSGVTLTPSFNSVYRNADRAAELSVNGHRLTQKFGKTWENELGLRADMGAWSVRGTAAYAKGSESSTQKSIGVSVGYRW